MPASVTRRLLHHPKTLMAAIAGLFLGASWPVYASDAELKSTMSRSAASPSQLHGISKGVPGTASDWSRITGDYFFGDGFEVNCSLHLPGNGQFSYQLDGCSGTHEQIDGTVRIQRNRLLLTPTGPAGKTTGRGFYNELLPVAWGERMYLIPANDIMGFVNAINRVSEPVSHGSHGRYYMREGDWDRGANGLPNLPGQWLNYILSKPVQARVVGRARSGQWKLDAGSSVGIYSKMELFATAPDKHALATLRVISVEDNVAYAEQLQTEKAVDLNTWSISSQAVLEASDKDDEDISVRNANSEVPPAPSRNQLLQ